MATMGAQTKERRVWEVRYEYVRGNPRYRDLLLAGDPPLEERYRLDELLASGLPLASEWIPLRVEYASDRPLADFCQVFDLSGLVMSERARAVLEPILGPHGEFLPLAGIDVPYFLYNCLTRIDPFDHQLSKVCVETRPGVSGKPYPCFMPPNWQWSLDLYELDETGIADVDVFALPGRDLLGQGGSAGLYVSDRVVEAICDARLTGLEFLQVWPREGRGTRRTSVPSTAIPDRRSGRWRERVRETVLRAGWHSVVLEREAVETQSGTLALEGHRSMVLDMLGAGLSIWELPPTSRLVHAVDDFWTEYLCGGFSQFVYNTHWNPETIALVREGLSRLGQPAYVHAFEKAVEFVEQMGADELEAFLEGEYFGDETTKELNEVDEYFEQARREVELDVVLGQWLLAQEPQVALEPWEITGWVLPRELRSEPASFPTGGGACQDGTGVCAVLPIDAPRSCGSRGDNDHRNRKG